MRRESRSRKPPARRFPAEPRKLSTGQSSSHELKGLSVDMTAPAKEPTWTEVGTRVDELLERLGLQLTMGGEPTFIVPRPESPEWNTEALGDEKLLCARRMAAALRSGPYKGGLTMQIFGKLFPGEALPRWVLLTLRREDGEPLSRVPRRHLGVGKGNKPSPPKDAGRLARDLAKTLGLSTSLIGADEPGKPGRKAAYVLPLDRTDEGWVSARWPLEDNGLLRMIPGDSPAGLRLPLHRVPEDRLRRALAIEEQDGVLQIFLPPLSTEAFLLLVAEIEASAERKDLRNLVLCGYPPPSDEPVKFVRIGLAADPHPIGPDPVPTLVRHCSFPSRSYAITPLLPRNTNS